MGRFFPLIPPKILPALAAFVQAGAGFFFCMPEMVCGLRKLIIYGRQSNQASPIHKERLYAWLLPYLTDNKTGGS